MNSLSFLYFCMWELGYPDRAWTRSREMLEVAQRSSVPHILAIASLYAALHNLIGGNPTAAQKHAEEAMVLTEEMGLVSFSALATTWHGAALIAQGRYEEGIAGMRHGISAIRASGAPPPAWTLSYLAFGLGKAGRPQEGLEVVEEGLASVAKTGEQLASPSLHHVKGELLLAQNPSDAAEVERCFRTAIEIARRQSARIDGVACHDEPRPAAREAGPSRRSARDARRNLQLVHRGLRHRRSERRQGAAR